MTLNSRLVNLAATAHKLVELGMMRGVSPSVSLRWEDVCYLSPAGARMDRLSAADFISLKIDGVNTWQLQRASSSYAIHLACYRARPDAATVLCLQPPHCIALGCAGLSIPAITPDFYLAFGAEIPLLPYHALASQELADGIGQLIVTHEAVLLQEPGPGTRSRQHGRGLCQVPAHRGSRPHRSACPRCDRRLLLLDRGADRGARAT